jgi:hypothetical protein
MTLLWYVFLGTCLMLSYWMWHQMYADMLMHACTIVAAGLQVIMEGLLLGDVAHIVASIMLARSVGGWSGANIAGACIASTYACMQHHGSATWRRGLLCHVPCSLTYFLVACSHSLPGRVEDLLHGPTLRWGRVWRGCTGHTQLCSS